jgi:hypothetical protein
MAWIAVPLLLAALAPQDAGGPDSRPRTAPRILWETDLDAALRESARDKKPTIVHFEAAWCPACKEFEERTLGAPEVLARADRFHWVRLDVDRDVALVRRFDLRSTPRTDLVDPDGRTRVRISGAIGPAELCRELERFLAERPREPASQAPRPLREVEVPESTPVTFTPEGYRSLSQCFSNVGFGPLRLSSQSPFQSLRIGLVPLTPSTLAEGQWEVHLGVADSNVFIKKPGEYLLQFDLVQSNLSVGFGLSNELEADLEYDQRSRIGGFMDQFIQHFHRAFGLTNQLRETEPLNGYALRFPASQSHPAVDVGHRSEGSYSNTLSFALRQNLTCGSEELPAVAVGLILRTPLGGSEDLEHEGPVDPGVTLSLAKRLGDFHFYASGLVAYYGHDSFRGIPLRPVQLSGLLAVEWQFLDWAAMVLQYQISQGVAEGLGPFGSPANELALGWKIEFAPRALLELGLIHTLLNNENSMDFGFTLGLTVRF